MEWNRSMTLGMASEACTKCNGDGLRKRTRKFGMAAAPCKCTLRAIFRACFERFCELIEKPKSLSKSSIEQFNGTKGRRCWGRKDEEYLADFYIIAKRTLDEEHLRIFRFHFLLGADCSLCCRRLDMDRGNFFHAVYRIEQQLGRAFTETAPYALFPLDEYFGGAIRKALPSAFLALKSNVVEMPKRGRPRKTLTVPLAPAHTEAA